jgi:hypothetical protein
MLVERLRVTLQRICDQSPECFEKASHKLLDSVDATDAPFPTGTQGQKRKRYEICSQCDKEYDVREDERGGPQCRWHEGTVPIICCRVPVLVQY